MKVSGTTFDGTETLTPESKVFISGRNLTIGDLYVCDHEVTQAEYETYCIYSNYEPNSYYGIGDNYPAYYISWYDAMVYCNLRSIAEDYTPVYMIENETDPSKWTDIVSKTIDGTTRYCGPSSYRGTWTHYVTFDTSANGYRLPTEVEWEYAARGGSEWKTYTYSGSDTIDDVAWYNGNSYYTTYTTHEVKTKQANSLGIYDMSGNVDEWCYDIFSSTITSTNSATGPTYSSEGKRAVRGGDYFSRASSCKVSYRGSWYGYNYSNYIGFRVVRNAE